MIKVAICHQLMPHLWHIFATAGLSPIRSIGCILQKPHLPDSSYRDPGKVDEGRIVDKGQQMHSYDDTYGMRVRLYSTVTYLAHLLFHCHSTRNKK